MNTKKMKFMNIFLVVSLLFNMFIMPMKVEAAGDYVDEVIIVIDGADKTLNTSKKCLDDNTACLNPNTGVLTIDGLTADYIKVYSTQGRDAAYKIDVKGSNYIKGGISRSGGDITITSSDNNNELKMGRVINNDTMDSYIYLISTSNVGSVYLTGNVNLKVNSTVTNVNSVTVFNPFKGHARILDDASVDVKITSHTPETNIRGFSINVTSEVSTPFYMADTTGKVSFEFNGGIGVLGNYTLRIENTEEFHLKGFPINTNNFKYEETEFEVLTSTTNEFKMVPKGAEKYDVILSTEGAGTLVTSDGNSSYEAGEVVTLVSTATSMSRFKEYQVVSGNVTITDNKFTMPAEPVEIKAVFEDLYNLNVGSGSGTGVYAEGDIINISANPASYGKAFEKWGGDTSVIANFLEQNTTVTMPAREVNIGVIYRNLPRFNIDVTTEGGGIVSANQNDALAGEEVTLFATPNEGYSFTGWDVITGGVDVLGNKFIMPDTDVSIEGIFSKNVYQLTVNDGSAIVMTSNVFYGDHVSVTAQDLEGKTFREWKLYNSSNEVIGTYAFKEVEFTMPAHDASIIAYYDDKLGYPIVLSTDGNGLLESNYTESYEGREIELTATPNPGYEFSHYEVVKGNITITDNKFIMPNEAVEIKAIFNLKDYDVVVIGGNGSGVYQMGNTVTIKAADALEGKEFDKWESADGIIFDNEYDMETTFEMIDNDVLVTALYKDKVQHDINITTDGNGTASANYEKMYEGKVITLNNTPNEGYEFSHFEVVKGNVNIIGSSFVMPNEEVEIKAIFKLKKYDVVIKGGLGSGKYIPNVLVTITANKKDGYIFDKWLTSSNIVLKDINSLETTFKMINEEVLIEALYKKIEEETSSLDTDVSSDDEVTSKDETPKTDITDEDKLLLENDTLEVKDYKVLYYILIPLILIGLIIILKRKKK